jgi:hypothetical protein
MEEGMDELELLQQRIDNGAHPNDMIWEIRHDDLETARLLLDNGADPNIIYQYVLTRWWVYGPQFVELLIEYEANVNLRDYQGDTLLHLTDDPYITQLLIDNGADVNMQNYAGYTPLHMVRTPIKAQILVDNGADSTIKNYINEIPLQTVRREYAIQNIDPETIVVLMTAAANTGSSSKQARFLAIGKKKEKKQGKKRVRSRYKST